MNEDEIIYIDLKRSNNKFPFAKLGLEILRKKFKKPKRT